MDSLNNQVLIKKSQDPTPEQGIEIDKSFNNLRLFLIVIVIIIFFAIILTTYLLNTITKQNTSTKITSGQPSKTIKLPEKNQEAVSYKIIDGSLYKIPPNEKPELIVHKTQVKLKELEFSEIYSYKLSSNNSKILLFTMVGLTPFSLSYYDLDTKVITFIDVGIEGIWSPNNRYIAYTRGQSDAGPLSIYVFDTTTNQNAEIIKREKEKYTNYENIQWASDSAAISAKFTTSDEMPNGKIVDKGKTIIKIK